MLLQQINYKKLNKLCKVAEKRKEYIDYQKLVHDLPNTPTPFTPIPVPVPVPILVIVPVPVPVPVPTPDDPPITLTDLESKG